MTNTYAESARVLRHWAADPGRMIGPLHRQRADELARTGLSPQERADIDAADDDD